MNLSFRARLLTIFLVTTTTFFILVTTAKMLNDKMKIQLEEVRNRYVPLIKLQPTLTNSYEKIGRVFQDSVAAQDLELLDRTYFTKSQFLKRLDEAQKVVSPEKLSQLKSVTESYFDSAYDLSTRMIKGETGILMIQKMMEMQEKQQRGDSLLRKTFAFDRNQLDRAFDDINHLQTLYARIGLITGVSCLLLVIAISWGLSRRLLISLQELSIGLSRFSQGNFAEPIKVVSNDEIGKVARQANQMAVQIKSLMKELESFSYSVAHDLRTPLRSILAYSNILIEDYSSTLPEEAADPLHRISRSAKTMGELIDSLLKFSRLTRKELKKQNVDLSMIAENILVEFKIDNPSRDVEIEIKESLEAQGDPQLLQIVLANLLGNSWKYTSKKDKARIRFGAKIENGERVFFVEDNGAGFDMKFYEKLFGTFQRLHSPNEFEGTGIGLAMVQNIIQRHGGRIWAHGEPDKGATFFFTIG